MKTDPELFVQIRIGRRANDFTRRFLNDRVAPSQHGERTQLFKAEMKRFEVPPALPKLSAGGVSQTTVELVQMLPLPSESQAKIICLQSPRQIGNLSCPSFNRSAYTVPQFMLEIIGPLRPLHEIPMKDASRLLNSTLTQVTGGK